MMSKEAKKNYVEEMKKNFTTNESVLIAQYQGLNVNELDSLRKELREKGILFKITKNRITKREKNTKRLYKINVDNLCNDQIQIERNLNQLYVHKKIKGYKIFDNSLNKKLTNESFISSCSDPCFMEKLSSKI